MRGRAQPVSLPPARHLMIHRDVFSPAGLFRPTKGAPAAMVTSSIPLPVPRLRLYFLSAALFQCSCTPRLCKRTPSGL